MEGRLGGGRSGKKASKEARTARLADALKVNLRRRKSQTRERARAGEAAPEAQRTATAAGEADHTVPGQDVSHEIRLNCRARLGRTGAAALSVARRMMGWDAGVSKPSHSKKQAGHHGSD